MNRNVLNMLGSFRSALAVAFGLPILVVASANAQAPAGPTEATTERVIVTGSYIPTAETESALPVTVYTAEVLQKQGANTPVEGIRQLPSFVGNALTENDSNGGDGTATINLRGVGSENTLVLMNGRRMFNQLGPSTDINLIPIGALSRTEILEQREPFRTARRRRIHKRRPRPRRRRGRRRCSKPWSARPARRSRFSRAIDGSTDRRPTSWRSWSRRCPA